MAEGDAPDWDDLRYFLRAAQCGSLAGAARAMGVEHTTIGRRVAALERRLGMPLFVRAADGLHLTAFGTDLLPHAEEVERAVLALHERAARQPARVRLALPTGLTKLFTAHLPRLRDAQPALALELLSGSRPVDLTKGEAELAIRSGPVRDQALVARRLCTSGWSLYAAPAYLARRPAPQDVDDLAGHDVIGYDPSLAGVPAAQWVEQRAAAATVVLRSREMTDMLAAALGGAGLALLPCLLADDEPGLVRLTPQVLATRELWLAYPREARLAAPVQAVVRFVVDVLREHAERVSGRRGAARQAPVPGGRSPP